MKKQKTQFSKTLLAWYHKHKRDLPWRRTQDPYKIWISEIMLQQTTVAAVIDYYHRFLKRFPDILSVATAKEEEVLALWSGLGYYSRAKNLHKAAQKIVEEHQGNFPKDPEKITELPGVGRYTLGAVASIAFDLPLPLVDGNVIRVYSRLFALKGSPKDAKFQKKIWEIAEEIIHSPSMLPPLLGERVGVRGGFTRAHPPLTLHPSPQGEGDFHSKGRGHYGDFNQALMELGATVCTPIGPLCPICPIQTFCKGKALGPEKFPEKKKGPETKILKRIAAVIEKKGKILLTLSEKHRWMKDLWQLPSLFSENGEKPETLAQKVLKEMGLHSKKMNPLKFHTHAITHHKITVQPYRIENPRGRLRHSPGVKREWVSFSDLKKKALPSADRKILFSSANIPHCLQRR